MKAWKFNELSEKAKEQVRRELNWTGHHRWRPGRVIVAGGISGAVADLERVVGHVALGTQEGAGYDGRVDIRIIERRRRLTDYGGSSHKYVVDALVSCGVLPDDRPEVVRRIEHEQERVATSAAKWPLSARGADVGCGEEEETVIEIWRVG